MDIKIDDEFKNLIPPLTTDEFNQLEQNIIAEGCRESLILWDDFIVDGHNRFEICTKHGIEFNTVEKSFNDKNSAKEWIIRNQFGRRNLELYQRSALVLILNDVIAARAKDNQLRTKENRVHQFSGEQRLNTEKELAKIAGVSHDTIHKTKVIQKLGTDEEKEKLQKGEIKISKVYRDIREREGTPTKPKKQVATEQTPEEKLKTQEIMFFYDFIHKLNNVVSSAKRLKEEINESIELNYNLPEPYFDEVKKASCNLQEFIESLKKII